MKSWRGGRWERAARACGGGESGVGSSGKLYPAQGTGDWEFFSKEGFDSCENIGQFAGPAGPGQHGDHVVWATGHVSWGQTAAESSLSSQLWVRPVEHTGTGMGTHICVCEVSKAENVFNVILCHT